MSIGETTEIVDCFIIRFFSRKNHPFSIISSPIKNTSTLDPLYYPKRTYKSPIKSIKNNPKHRQGKQAGTKRHCQHRDPGDHRVHVAREPEPQCLLQRIGHLLLRDFGLRVDFGKRRVQNGWVQVNRRDREPQAPAGVERGDVREGLEGDHPGVLEGQLEGPVHLR